MLAQIELRDLRVFLTLADEMHFGRAADRSGVTPARVSQTIKMLERRFGGPLFARTSRRVSLTPLGELLRDRLIPVVEQLDQALYAVADTASGMTGTLRLGTYAPIFDNQFIALIRDFGALYPDCHVEVIETGLGSNPLDWLRRREVDALLMRLPLDAPDITIGPILSTENRVLLVAADHPLAGRTTVEYEDLADYVVPDSEPLPRELMDAIAPPVTPSGRVLRRAKVHSIGEVIMRVATGEVVHPTVASILEHFPREGVVTIPLTGLPPSQTALVWLSGNDGLKLQTFVAMLKSAL